MKKLLFLLLLLLGRTTILSQDFKAEFDEFFELGDTTSQIELLKKWEAINPIDPELFTSYFNYYFIKARQEILSMTTNQPEEESLSFQDSTGNTVGYIGSKLFFTPEIMEKGLVKIDAGIKLYPDRLDMIFGKIYALGQIEDWQRFTDEIIKTIKYSDINKNNWKWTYNQPRANGEQFFLTSLQDYQLALYNTGNDNLLSNMREIAEEVLKYYPKHIESLSNISITYLLTGKYENAIETLLRAEKINPKDGIILANIAHGYKLKGDIKNAIKYYEKLAKTEDTEMVDFAKQQIEELKK